MARITFEGEKRTKAQQKVDGAALLKSIPLLVKHLGFEPPLILLDEAETAVEKKGSAKRKEFLKVLAFLNDHVAHGANQRLGHRGHRLHRRVLARAVQRVRGAASSACAIPGRDERHGPE